VCVCVCALYVFSFWSLPAAYKTHGATTTTTKGCNVIISCVCVWVCDTVFFYGKKHKVLIPPSAGRIWRLYCCGGVLSTHNSSAQENNIIIYYYYIVVHTHAVTGRRPRSGRRRRRDGYYIIILCRMV